MPSKSINAGHLERMFRIMHDTKKELEYDKHGGCWFWHDRDDPKTQQGPHETAHEAMLDACDPYLNPED